MLIPFVGPVLVEVITQESSTTALDDNINSITNAYEKLYSKDSEIWPNEIKFMHLKECSDLRNNHPHGGLITRIINKNHDLDMRKETFSGMREILWGKEK